MHILRYGFFDKEGNMRRLVQTKPMREILYRETRVARILGEPSKYKIINVLLRYGPINVYDITKRVQRSQPTVSHHLAALKKLEIVRYETKSDCVYYWVKYPQELRAILESLQAFIQRTQKGLDSET